MMNQAREIRLEPGWKAHLEDEFRQPYMQQLRSFLLERKRQGAVIFDRMPASRAALRHFAVKDAGADIGAERHAGGRLFEDCTLFERKAQ